ncbi:MAG TPA: hypothetical protein VHV08_12770, partial [Pirellulales bacterium]|nr:hypothetical protein [Pirellulales bacterium]
MSEPIQPNTPRRPPPINPHDVGEPPGMSGTAKVFLGFGIGCAVVLLICCGGLGFMSVVGYRIAQNSQINEPDQIEALVEKIVTITIPDSLRPERGYDVVLPLVGPFGMGAFYTNATRDAHLIIGQFNPALSDRENLEIQVRASVTNVKDEELEVKESEPFDTKINGEPAQFTISQGIGRQSHQEL